MQISNRIKSLLTISSFLEDYLSGEKEHFPALCNKLDAVILKTEQENPWFTKKNIIQVLEYWKTHLNQDNLTQWLNEYSFKKNNQRIGLILAGNIPMVGFHDVLCVLLSGNIAIIKLSTKDKNLTAFFLEFWKDICPEIEYDITEKLTDFDKVIATGSNNTARYFEYYFKDKPHVIRKNRTSVAVLSGNESKAELSQLGKDIFSYFGLGCRNVTQLLVPKGYNFDAFFEALFPFKEIINHNKYGNGYDYQKAIFLLNQDKFWDNNFVLLKESDALFSPMATVFYTEYSDLNEVSAFITQNEDNIQCVVSNISNLQNVIPLGEAQNPALNTYADGVDTMEWLS